MSGCTLQLTRNCPLRTVLVDEATGRAKYRIDTPIKFARSVTRVRRLDSPAQPLHHRDSGIDSDPDDDITDVGNHKKKPKPKDEEDEDEVLPESQSSDEIARIYWKWFSPHRIVFRGRITTRTEFLPKAGKMGGSYAFTGPDGVQYRWAMGAMGMNYPKLVTTDGRKRVIARFHRAHYFRNKRNARLEVQPAGMGMLDYIVLTFIFAESKRKERERRAKYQ